MAPRKRKNVIDSAPAAATTIETVKDITNTDQWSYPTGTATADLIIHIPAQRILETRVGALKLYRDNHDRIRMWEGYPADSMTPNDYRTLDELLGVIQDAKKEVMESYEPIISTLRGPLEGFYELRRGAIGYVEEDETLVKKTMADYKTAERKRILAQEEEDRRKAKEIADREAEALRIAEEANKTASDNAVGFVGGLTPDKTNFVVPAITYLSPPSANTTPVRGSHSTARPVKQWRVTDLPLLIDAALMGLVPLDILTINPDVVNMYFKLDSGKVGQWPGMDVYEEMKISGR